MLTMADQYKVVYDLSYGAIFNDLERPLPLVSRSRYSLTLNISETVRLYSFNEILIATYTCPTQQCHFGLGRMTSLHPRRCVTLVFSLTLTSACGLAFSGLSPVALPSCANCAVSDDRTDRRTHRLFSRL